MCLKMGFWVTNKMIQILQNQTVLFFKTPLKHKTLNIKLKTKNKIEGQSKINQIQLSN